MSTASIQLYFSGDRFFQDAIESIEKAESEVLLESYIFDLDPIGIRVLNALKSAHSRGVRVRLLVDGIGTFNWMRPLVNWCSEHHIPIRVYHPLPIVTRMSWRNLRRMLFLFRRINQRNHRKVILIDQKKVFLGSLNISQVHTKEFLGGSAWRDTGVTALFEPGNQDVHVLREAFLHTWKKTQGVGLHMSSLKVLKRLRRKKMHARRFRLNSRVWWRYRLQRDLLKRIRRAKTRILITNAYFVPRRSLTVALRRAAKRGVYVGLCLPQKTDIWLVREASRVLFQRLIKDGVHIYEYQPSILHAKTLVIDQWATVGSYNLNHRSLLHDLEVEMVIEESEQIQQLATQWEKDLNRSDEITLEELGHVSFLRRWVARLFYWFRYWL